MDMNWIWSKFIVITKVNVKLTRTQNDLCNKKTIIFVVQHFQIWISLIAIKLMPSVM